MDTPATVPALPVPREPTEEERFALQMDRMRAGFVRAAAGVAIAFVVLRVLALFL